MELLAYINLRIPSQLTNLIDLLLQLDQGLLKLEQGTTRHQMTTVSELGLTSGGCDMKPGMQIER